MRTCALVLAAAAMAVLCGAGCPAPGTPPPDPPLDPIAEIEPNDDPPTAQVINAAAANAVRVVGTIATGSDADVFDLGSVHRGDRVSVELSAEGTTLEAAASLFDAEADLSFETLIAVNDQAIRAVSSSGVAMDVALRHDTERLFLAISRAFGSIVTGDAYDLTVRIERAAGAPAPTSQRLLLDFDGGTALTRSGQSIAVSAFEASDIDPIYAGQTRAVRAAIIRTVREDYAGFHVEIRTSDESGWEGDEPFSTVFFGRLESGEPASASEGFGVAIDGVDAYNGDPRDTAIIFVHSFRPETFGFTEPLNADALGAAIGNVGSHEAGHLLGLHHTFDPSDVMNTFDAPATLLLDRRFKRAVVDFSIADPLGSTLTQDGRRLLRETVGETVRTANTTVPTGQTPTDLAAADVNGDGRPDLVAANRFGSSISVLLGDGQGGVLPATDVNVGAGPLGVLAFDADGDGDSDLLTANPAAQNLTLLSNPADGQFTIAGTLTAGERPRAMASADFNGDGDLDVGVVDFDSSAIVVLSNDGQGGFFTGMPAPVGTNPQAVLAGDWNGDGRADLVTVNSASNDISVLLNNGNFGFDTQQSVVGLLPFALAAGDFDGDGIVDLASATALSSVFSVQFASDLIILRGQGDGTFVTSGSYFVGAIGQSMAVGDFDGDGAPDVAVACGGDPYIGSDQGQLSVLRNRGDGTFEQDVIYQTGNNPASVIAVDLDGDGDLDLAAANSESDSVSIYLNDGRGHFGVPTDGFQAAP